MFIGGIEIFSVQLNHKLQRHVAELVHRQYISCSEVFFCFFNKTMLTDQVCVGCSLHLNFHICPQIFVVMTRQTYFVATKMNQDKLEERAYHHALVLSLFGKRRLHFFPSFSHFFKIHSNKYCTRNLLLRHYPTLSIIPSPVFSDVPKRFT